MRNNHPKRRSEVAAYGNYRQYKPYLREDFLNRCGYCNDSDRLSGGERGFQIDHFAPKSKFPHLGATYSNLVYSCAYCNRAKWDHWPSASSEVHNDGLVGFVDPCADEFVSHLERDDQGCIRAVTPLGEFMHRTLKLYLERHRLAWLLSELEEQLRVALALRAKLSHGSDEDIELLILIATLTENTLKMSDEFFK